MRKTESRIQYETLAFEDVFSSVLAGLALLPQAVAEDDLEEQDRRDYNNLQHEVRRSEFGVSRLLIRELATDLHPDCQRVRLIKDEAGRPEAEIDEQVIHASLAHTQGAVLAALSPDQPVGLDLEPIGRKVHGRLRKRLLTPKEREMLGHPEEVSTLRLWTIKEACLKLGGTGLRKALHSVQIRKRSDRYFTATLHDEKKVKICSFRHRRYWMAVAVYLQKDVMANPSNL